MATVRMKRETFVNGTVAHLPGVRRTVDALADEIGAKAQATLARHRQTGNAYIEVNKNLPGKYGKIDAEVDLVDRGKTVAAAAIEFGHEQVVFGKRTGKYTPGIYAVTGAAGLA